MFPLSTWYAAVTLKDVVSFHSNRLSSSPSIVSVFNFQYQLITVQLIELKIGLCPNVMFSPLSYISLIIDYGLAVAGVSGDLCVDLFIEPNRAWISNRWYLMEKYGSIATINVSSTEHFPSAWNWFSHVSWCYFENRRTVEIKNWFSTQQLHFIPSSHEKT